MPNGAIVNELPLQQDPFTTGPQFEAFCGWFLREQVVVTLTDHQGKAVRYELAGVEPSKAPGARQGGRDFEGWAHCLTAAGRTDEPPERWFFECKHRKGTAPFDLKAARRAVADCPTQVARRKILLVSHAITWADEFRKEFSDWDVWDTRRVLGLLLDLAPPRAARLIHRCFGASWVKRLVPGAGANASLLMAEIAYEHLLNPDRLFYHPEIFCGSDRVLTALQAHCQGGGPQVVLLLGGGGAGKSRLLLELARRLTEGDDAREVLFINALASPLELEGEYFEPRSVWVLDDAHLWPQPRLQVLRAALARSSEGGVLIIAARPQVKEELQHDVRKAGYDGTQIACEIVAQKWKDKDLRGLLHKLLPTASSAVVGRLVQLAGGSPLLATLAAQLINQKRLSPLEVGSTVQFREEVFHKFASANLEPLAKEAVEADWMRLLELLAILSPTDYSDGFASKAAEFLGCSVDELELRISRLGETGIVQINDSRHGRKSLRIWPDVFSDHLVVRACSERRLSGVRFAQRVGGIFGQEEYPGVLRNLAMAAWTLGQTDPVGSEALARNTATEFRQAFDNSSWLERWELLRRWGNCASFLPDETLDLIEYVVTLKVAPRPLFDGHDDAGGDHDSGRQALVDELPPLLGAVASHYGEVRQGRALDLLWSLRREQKGGRLPWRKVSLEQLGEIVTHGLRFNLEIAVGVWRWVQAKIAELCVEDVTALSGKEALLSELLVPFIARQNTAADWEDDQVLLPDSNIDAGSTHGLRLEVFALAREIAAGPDPVLACALLPFLRRATGRGHFGLEWLSDQLRSIEIGREMLRQHTSPVVQFALRRFLLESLDTLGELAARKAAVEALATVQDSPEMDALLACASSIDDFGQSAPARESIEYGRRLEARDDFIQNLPTRLVGEFKSPQSLASWLSSIATEAEQFGFPFSVTKLGKAILAYDPSYAKALAEALPAVEESQVDWIWWSLLDKPGAEDWWRERRLELARIVAQNPRRSLISAVIYGLCRWLDGEAERAFAVELAGLPAGAVFHEWVSSMYVNERSPFATLAEIVRKVPRGESTSSSVRETLFRVGALGQFPPDVYRRDLMGALLCHLEDVLDLGDSADYNLGVAVAHYYPEVMAFLVARMRRAALANSLGFEVLPERFAPLPTGAVPEGEQTQWMKEMWNNIPSAPGHLRWEAARVFQVASANSSTPLETFLSERIEGADTTEELVQIALVLDQGRRLAMPWPAKVIRQALVCARQHFSRKEAEEIEKSFFNACVPSIWGWSGGRPNERTMTILENLRRLKIHWAHDQVLGNFWTRALREAEQRYYQ